MAISSNSSSDFPFELAQKVHTLVLDVDGVMTDGGLYYDTQNQVMKRFNVQDGLGIKLAFSAGLNIAVITGLVSASVEMRVTQLGITDYFAGFHDKRECLQKIAHKHGIELTQMAYLGDDWVDLSVMKLVGLPLAVANAQPEVKDISRYITHSYGGNGAVREVIRNILIAQKKYDDLLSQWSN